MKYKSIKINGVEATSIVLETKFPWLQLGYFENAEIETNDSLLIWKGGFWKGGTWEYGIWGDGIWEDGIWEGGIWKYGTWKGGTWEGGIWKYGTWKGGTWEDGTWEDGTWEDGIWKGGTWSYNGYYLGSYTLTHITIGCMNKRADEWRQFFKNKEFVETDPRIEPKKYKLIKQQFKEMEFLQKSKIKIHGAK